MLVKRDIKRFSSYLRKIRDLSNSFILTNSLVESENLKSQLFSCLDYAEDTHLVISDYYFSTINKRKDENPDSLNYLFIIGVLQTLFSQQDSIINMLESLKIIFDLSKNEILSNIRNIRNITIGHPTKKKISKELFSYNYLVRHSLSPSSFEMFYYEGNSLKSKSKVVKIGQLIEDQYLEIFKILRMIKIELEKRVTKKKKSFAKENLEELFMKNVSYDTGKMIEFCYGERTTFRVESSKWAFERIKKFIDVFKKALIKRGINVESGEWKYQFKQIYYSINELLSEINVFQSGNADLMKYNTTMHEVLTEFISSKLNDFQESAKNIDNEYSLKKPQKEKQQPISIKITYVKPRTPRKIKHP